MNELKVCSKCGEAKPFTEFFKAKDHLDGFYPSCKICKKLVSKDWEHRNIIKHREKKKSWRNKNKEKCNAKVRGYYHKHKDKVSSRVKAYRKEHPEIARKATRNFRLRHHEESIQKGREYYRNNLVKCIAMTRNWERRHPEHHRLLKMSHYQRKKIDPQYKLSRSISGNIWKSLRENKGGLQWTYLLDFGLEQLKEHLEKQFQTGMNWENYGKAWHIDHVIPIKVFNFETHRDIDFKRCWALNNLAPLWVSKNCSKGAKLSSAFQPSLQLRAA